MDRIVTKAYLRELLGRRGHTSWQINEEPQSFAFWPPAEIGITVALELDATLYPQYRLNYFACRRDADDFPVLFNDAAFALVEPFASAAELQPIENYFMMGPLRWLLMQLRRFKHVLLWPQEGFSESGGLGFLDDWHSMPHLGTLFRGQRRDVSVFGAVWLDLAELFDCQVLWEAANLVGLWHYNFFVSDHEGREVYLLHHHDKIVVSIPERESRLEFLEELARLTDFFSDESGYECESDSEILNDVSDHDNSAPAT